MDSESGRTVSAQLRGRPGDVQMEAQVTCKALLQAENATAETDTEHHPTTTSDKAAAEIPAKKQTRQWAAWTREEEECFFTAMRQVGKNFEKITHRVQSKNKDQVRHYYYRLVRRMNKLLGPDFCLDAKNSKDTIAAMLRWWSLLQKYSCRASKLHLKPRRFKVFVEALEHQLLKDRRKKSVGGKDVQKFRSQKRTAKRKQRQIRSEAAIADKEAAIAGVCLVADAAEHLESIAADVGNAQRQESRIDGPKLKVQFFPMDEGTGRALEKEKRNPYLELTLRGRKKMSSVVKHLDRKWGGCVDRGGIVLFPYDAMEGGSSCAGWSAHHSHVTAADVHKQLGYPSTFRLRYAWRLLNSSSQPPQHPFTYAWDADISMGDLLLESGDAPDNLPDSDAHPSSSVWGDAEDARDAFSFKNDDAPIAKDLSAAPQLDLAADVYWPDSLGPLDFDMRPCRYQSEGLISCDTNATFNHLLPTSLDSFQNSNLFAAYNH